MNALLRLHIKDTYKAWLSLTVTASKPRAAVRAVVDILCMHVYICIDACMYNTYYLQICVLARAHTRTHTHTHTHIPARTDAHAPAQHIF